MKATNIRKGSVLLHNNQPHRVMSFQHVTPGKGNAVVQVKLRNLITGNQTDQRYMSSADVDEADVFIFKATYLYKDGEGYVFMNNDSYEQATISADLLGDDVYYLQEQMNVNVTLFDDNPIGIELPSTVVLTVVETEPELKGATASNSPKPAKTDTGLQLNVPPFIKQGEKIIVNTADGTYSSRADS